MAGGFKQALNGECFPSVGGATHPSDHTKIISNLLGSFGDMFKKTLGHLFSNSVCEFIRTTSETIINNFIKALSGNPESISVLVGTATKFAFPFAVKKVIDATVDGVFKCFEDPKHAAKVREDANKFMKEEDEKLKSKNIKGFTFVGEDEDEDEDEDEEEEWTDDEEEEEEERASFYAEASFKASAKADQEAIAAAKASAKASAKADQEAKAKAKAAASAKAKAAAKASAKADQEAKAKAKASAKASAKAEREAKAAASAKAKADKAAASAKAKASAKAEREAKALASAKAKASAKAEREAKAASAKAAKASAKASAKAEREAKASAKAKAKEEELKARQTIKLAKASAKASAKSKASASNRKTRKIRVNSVVATNRPVRVLTMDDYQSPAITKEEFDENLRDLGAYDEYYKLVARTNQKCLISGGGMMKGGFIPLASILTALPVLIYGSFAAGTVWLNWGTFLSAQKNWALNSSSYLLQPNYAHTNFVLNLFGLGVPCAAKHSIYYAAFSAMAEGASLYTIFTFAATFNEEASETLTSFAPYASAFYAYMKL